MFLSLPPVLKRKISEFCNADSVLSLASTCREIQEDLSVSVLSPPFELVEHKIYSGGNTLIRQGEIIPVFFAQRCHSVRLTCNFYSDGTGERSQTTDKLFLVARPKRDQKDNNSIVSKKKHPQWIQDDRGNEGTILVCCQSPSDRNGVEPSDRNGVELDTTFRYDPTQNYFIWYQCGENYLIVQNQKVRQLLTWDDVNHMLKNTYAKCMELDRQLEFEGKWARFQRSDDSSYHYCPPGHQVPECSFMARLFALALETIELESNEESSSRQPIKAFLESWSTDTGSTWKKIARGPLVALKRMAAVYLQLVEQEGSKECSEIARLTATQHPINTEAVHLVALPPILLKETLGSDSKSTRRANHISSTEEAPRVFVTRVPVPSETKSFGLTASRSENSKGTFLLLAKILKDSTMCQGVTAEDRRSANNFSANDDFELIWQLPPGEDFDVDVNIIPDHAKAYYLYYQPVADFSCTEEFYSLHVHLWVLDDENESSTKVFERFLGLLGADVDHEGNENSHLGLLQAVAEALRLHKESPSSVSLRKAQSIEALTELLASEGFSTDSQGLECVVQLSDEMLRYRRGDWPEQKGKDDPDRLLFRTHAAM
jgi:hypothetical protein